MCHAPDISLYIPPGHINARGLTHSIHFHYIHFSDRFCSTFSLLSLSRIKHTLTYIFIYIYYDFPPPDTYSHAGGAYGDITPRGHFRFRELGGDFNKALQAAQSPASCTKPCKLYKSLQAAQNPTSCTKPCKLYKALQAAQSPASCAKPYKLYKALQAAQSPTCCTKPCKLCKALQAAQSLTCSTRPRNTCSSPP